MRPNYVKCRINKIFRIRSIYFKGGTTLVSIARSAVFQIIIKKNCTFNINLQAAGMALNSHEASPASLWSSFVLKRLVLSYTSFRPLFCVLWIFTFSPLEQFKRKQFPYSITGNTIALNNSSLSNHVHFWTCILYAIIEMISEAESIINPYLRTLKLCNHLYFNTIHDYWINIVFMHLWKCITLFFLIFLFKHRLFFH